MTNFITNCNNLQTMYITGLSFEAIANTSSMFPTLLQKMGRDFNTIKSCL